jgi:hypothetical protein
MRVSVAAAEKAEEDRWQIGMKVSVGGITGNHVNISRWYTIFDLGDMSDLIVDKDWMAPNLHIINKKTNTLHMREPNWTGFPQGSRLQSTIVTTSLVSLQLHKEQLSKVRAHWKTVAHTSEIHIDSVSFFVRCTSSERVIVNIRKHIDKILEKEEEETTPYTPADLKTWWGLVLATGLDRHFGSGYGSEPNRSQIGCPGRQ